ncbi:MAG: SagB/ThcOx family dehydrogenase [Candidatus Micrarchaeia archaeon]
MDKFRKAFLVFVVLAFLGAFVKFVMIVPGEKKGEEARVEGKVILPRVNYEGISVEKAISSRRSVRDFADENMTIEDLSLLLFAGQGITDEKGHRTAPSAGALYPVTLYVHVNRVSGLKKGLYYYSPNEEALIPIRYGDFSGQIVEACVGQRWVGESAASIIVVADFGITREKYGERGDDYVYMEAGHIGQNVLLEAVSLGLGGVPVGGFDRRRMGELLGLDDKKTPVYVLSIGKKR